MQPFQLLDQQDNKLFPSVASESWFRLITDASKLCWHFRITDFIRRFIPNALVAGTHWWQAAGSITRHTEYVGERCEDNALCDKSRTAPSVRDVSIKRPLKRGCCIKASAIGAIKGAGETAWDFHETAWDCHENRSNRINSRCNIASNRLSCWRNSTPDVNTHHPVHRHTHSGTRWIFMFELQLSQWKKTLQKYKQIFNGRLFEHGFLGSCINLFVNNHLATMTVN